MSTWEKQSFSIECQREGMSAFFPKEGKYDEKKGNVLFVSHIVDRTGAPLVLFDLMKHYQKTYNVFLVTMMEISEMRLYSKTYRYLLGCRLI